MQITVDKNELYALIKEAVREVLKEEAIDFFLKSVPALSEEEMKDIERQYGEPLSKKEAAYSETVEL
jgi:hypothetical protein